MTQLTYKASKKERDAVKVLTACGHTHDEVAKMLKIDVKTLRKCFKKELEVAGMQANAKVMSSIYRAATQDNNLTAAIFWAKTRGAGRGKRGSAEGGSNAPPPLVLKVQ